MFLETLGSVRDSEQTPPSIETELYRSICCQRDVCSSMRTRNQYYQLKQDGKGWLDWCHFISDTNSEELLKRSFCHLFAILL